MATRFCVHCGTEVDEQAAFCPACGNPLDGPPVNEIPAAPAWPQRARSQPEPEPEDEPELQDEAEVEPEAGVAADALKVPSTDTASVEGAASAPPPRSEPPLPDWLSDTEPEPIEPHAEPEPEATRVVARIQPTAEEDAHESEGEAADEREPLRPASLRPSARPGPEPAPGAGGPAQSSGDRPGGVARQLDLPITWPVTLSGWLIGVGAFVGALAVVLDFRAFVNPVTLIAFVVLLAVAATVFLAANVPQIPHRQLWVLVAVLIAFGAALERVGGGTAFAGLVFFLGSGAAAIGAVILELGLDRPLGGNPG